MPKQIVHEGDTYEEVAEFRLTPQGEDELAIIYARDRDGDPQARKTLYVGVFFDGTGQNMEVDERQPDKDISNIAKLYLAYRETDEPDRYDHTYQRIYQRGVGTVSAEDGTDSTRESLIGLGLGIGPEGGHIRIKDTFDKLNDIPNLNTYNDIVFDVFGFSRGASLARHFTNLVNAWPARVQIPYLPTGNYNLLRPGILNLIGSESVRAFPQGEGVRGRVRFLGLFDTVGSFYLPGNDRNLDFNLNLQPDSAEQVIQFTAHHEFRHNFPLSSLRAASGNLPANFLEEVLPGVHTDVGGGYPNPYEATFHNEAWRTQIIRRHAGLGLSSTGIQNTQRDAERQGYYIRILGTDIQVEDRQPIFHELSYWVLEKMVKQISTHIPSDIFPFDSICFSQEDADNQKKQNSRYFLYLIPDVLKQKIAEWQASGGNLETSMDYLKDYIHVSHGAWWNPVSRPADNNTRIVFFNNPG